MFDGLSNLKSIVIDEDIEPMPDIATCAECNWHGPVSECPTGMESEGWEHPKYLIHYCPKCEDGGLIDDYIMSPEQSKKWNKWYKKKKEAPK